MKPVTLKRENEKTQGAYLIKTTNINYVVQVCCFCLQAQFARLQYLHLDFVLQQVLVSPWNASGVDSTSPLGVST